MISQIKSKPQKSPHAKSKNNKQTNKNIYNAYHRQQAIFLIYKVHKIWEDDDQ